MEIFFRCVGTIVALALIAWAVNSFYKKMGNHTSIMSDGRGHLRDLWPFWVASALLFVMLASDMVRFWEPEGATVASLAWSTVWANHSVWSSLLTTMFTATIVYSLWRLARERKVSEERDRQDRLAVTVSAAGLAGMVDHLVDVEILLSMSMQTPESAGRWNWALEGDDLVYQNVPEKEFKKRLRKFRESETQRKDDVRQANPAATIEVTRWRANLVDQAVRRLIGGMGSWATLISRSNHGEALLVLLAELRISLVELEATLKSEVGHIPSEEILAIRQQARFLALFFEHAGRAPLPRSEVLAKGDGLLPVSSRPDFLRHPDAAPAIESFPKEWVEAWSTTCAALSFSTWEMMSWADPTDRGAFLAPPGTSPETLGS